MGGAQRAHLHFLTESRDNNRVQARGDPIELDVDDVRGANDPFFRDGADVPELQYLPGIGAKGVGALSVRRRTRARALDDDRRAT